jgi:hypothetical protein
MLLKLRKELQRRGCWMMWIRPWAWRRKRVESQV